MRVHKREVVPHLENDGTVSLQEIDEDSPSRALVAEMMVLANSLFAEYASQHGIPILFRAQEKPDEEPTEVNGQAPVGPARDFGSRVKMKKSTVGIVAQPHAGLGVKAYSQLTSPIRRYMDLCHQRQLLSFMQRGRPWLEAKEFEELSQRVEVHLQAATLASRETRRFWLLRYLEQRPRSESITGTVVRTDLKSPLIELDEVFITLFARAPRALKLGDRVTMKISAVEPHADYVRLEIL
jgi:exoribonuclease-2